MKTIQNKLQFLLMICLVFSGKTDAFSQGFALLDNQVQTWVDSGYYHGANLIVGNRQKVLHQKSFGNYQPQTSTYIASAGKWLASATIAVLVDEGKLSWDDKVIKWLPKFADAKGQATLRQLFSHTANYPDYQPRGNHRDDYQTLEESVKHILPLAIEKPIDSFIKRQFHYGGLAMQVAGRMAELATGKTWESIFQEKIARPLQMSHTHFTPVDSVGGGHSPMLGGGAVSTVNDYAHFLQMFLNKGVYKGKRILSEKAIAEMQADQIGDAFVKMPEFPQKVRAAKHKSIYGLGLWREEIDKKGNATLISSPSWAGAYPWIDYKNGTFGFLLTHIVDRKMGKNNFNSFYASPILAYLLREELRQLPKNNIKGKTSKK